MRIDNPPYLVDLKQTQQLPQALASSASPAQSLASKAAAKSVDQVAISSGTREIYRLKQQLSALPDVRLDRVALAKQQLQQGGRLDSTLLAQKMLAIPGNG